MIHRSYKMNCMKNKLLIPAHDQVFCDQLKQYTVVEQCNLSFEENRTLHLLLLKKSIPNNQ